MFTNIIYLLFAFIFTASGEKFFTVDEVDTPPEFPNGIEEFYAYLNRHTNYPCIITQDGEYPSLFMVLDIDKSGQLFSIKIKEPTNDGFEKALLKAVPVNVKWEPGLLNGQPVNVSIELEIRYTLSSDPEEYRRSIVNEDKKPFPVFVFMGVIIAFFIIWIIFRFSNGRELSVIDFFASSPDSRPALIKTNVAPHIERFLLQEFKFYKTLNHRQRKKFGHRMNHFMYEKKFVGREELEVTEEMKQLIAATAVRITFGLRSFDFPSFHTIILYPDLFKSAISKVNVRGETHGAGFIVFSWKAFKFGLSDDTDSLNLGYHEFGHALFIERFKNNIDVRFINYYDKWREVVFTKGKLKEASMKKTFRKYATHNEHEFFAVAIENFFERPEKFKEDLPHLFLIMTKMLNQNPLLKPKKKYDRTNY